MKIHRAGPGGGRLPVVWPGKPQAAPFAASGRNYPICQENGRPTRVCAAESDYSVFSANVALPADRKKVCRAAIAHTALGHLTRPRIKRKRPGRQGSDLGGGTGVSDRPGR